MQALDRLTMVSSAILSGLPWHAAGAGLPGFMVSGGLTDVQKFHQQHLCSTEVCWRAASQKVETFHAAPMTVWAVQMAAAKCLSNRKIKLSIVTMQMLAKFTGACAAQLGLTAYRYMCDCRCSTAGTVRIHVYTLQPAGRAEGWKRPSTQECSAFVQG